MLRRSADALYWMGRYIERADDITRFIDVNAQLLLECRLKNEIGRWHPLIATSGDEGKFLERYSDFNESSVLEFLCFDTENPNSIISCISQARYNASMIRELLPLEAWEEINHLYHQASKNYSSSKMSKLGGFLSEVKHSNFALNGILYNSLSRDAVWHFTHLGQLIERADKTSRLIDVKYFLLLPNSERVNSAYDAVEWGAVLRSADAFHMYRQRYHSVDHLSVVQFLILDASFPRSILYCVSHMEKLLKSLREEGHVPQKEGVFGLSDLERELLATKAQDIVDRGLHEYLDSLQNRLNYIDSSLNQLLF